MAAHARTVTERAEGERAMQMLMKKYPEQASLPRCQSPSKSEYSASSPP